MSFVLSAKEVGAAEMSAYRALLEGAEWKRGVGRDYLTADVTHRVPGVKRAFFLKLPPQTRIHAHVDVCDCRTDHIVLETNEECRNYWGHSGEFVHMRKDWRYSVDRSVWHWATNDGTTERTHLLVEY